MTLWTIALQVPLSVGFSRQEYWSGFPCPPPGDLPDPGVQPVSLTSPASAVGSLPLVPPRKPSYAPTTTIVIVIVMEACTEIQTN